MKGTAYEPGPEVHYMLYLFLFWLLLGLIMLPLDLLMMVA
jgi:hypothetical protein